MVPETHVSKTWTLKVGLPHVGYFSTCNSALRLDFICFWWLLVHYITYIVQLKTKPEMTIYEKFRLVHRVVHIRNIMEWSYNFSPQNLLKWNILFSFILIPQLFIFVKKIIILNLIIKLDYICIVSFFVYIFYLYGCVVSYLYSTNLINI